MWEGDGSNIVDPTKLSLYISLLSIAFNPTFWNIVARNEYRSRTITRLLNGRARAGCYVLASCIFGLGLIRDVLYTRALLEQPQLDSLRSYPFHAVAVVLFLFGQLLVLSSTYALGITGTYLGDYFGILMESRVEGFPFNILRDPMYVGSTLCFVAGAVWYARPAGFLICAFVWATYVVALHFEGPFTDAIYSARNAQNKPATSATSTALAPGSVSTRKSTARQADL